MDPETVESLLTSHLEVNDLWQGHSKSWTIRRSSLGGRGIFAKSDIAPGDLIYVDAPLVVGPRSQIKRLPMCVQCYITGCPLFPCDRGCGLPVCSSECEASSEHCVECEYLRKWKPLCGSSWSVDLLRAVVPIRTLSLSESQRRLVYALECHRGPQHGQEIDGLKSNIEIQMSPEEEVFMRRICTVLDTNSFETAALVNKSVTSLRGLYPMGALQNHSCVPNTRHHYDLAQRLYVTAVLPIRKGEEITMTYTDIFWDTTLRRRHLAGTKHFLCKCPRCADPQENGSLLGALKCADTKCPGSLLADDPLNFATLWICNECGLKVNNRQIISIRSALGSIAEEMIHESPDRILRFIKRELSLLVPSTNHVMVDMKIRAVSYLGRIDNFLWEDLSETELETKKTYCRDLLSLINTLGCGDCKMKGLITYELYCTNMEQMRRRRVDRNIEISGTEPVADENIRLLEKAARILERDISAPEDFFHSISRLRANRTSSLMPST